MDAVTDVGKYPKAVFRSAFESGSGRLRVKVDLNTYETSPARPHVRLAHEIDSPWWTGRAEVLTFEPVELIATKLRALYQRRKGRDLFDLWLALTEMSLDPSEILFCFEPYRPDACTSAAAIANLEEHLGDRGFREDLLALTSGDITYDIHAAAALVRQELLEHVGQARA